jgi:ankyrin repeat protein
MEGINMKKQLISILFLSLVVLSPNSGRANESVDSGIDIWTAAASGDCEAVELHLTAGTDVDIVEPAGGSSPLIIASLFGQAGVVRLLTSRDADLDLRNQDGATALHVAAFFGQPEIVSLLLERGADVEIRNNFGQTALEGVSGKWSSDLEGIYKMVGAMWELDLDLDRIREARPKIADLIRRHTDS